MNRDRIMVHGVRVKWITNDPRIEVGMRHLLRSFIADSPIGDSDGRRILLRLSAVLDQDSISEMHWQSRYEVDYTNGEVAVQLQSSDLEDPGRTLWLLNIAVLFALAQRGLYPLHAACIVRNNIGYLILGPSGSGKSTLVLNLIHSGWKYLSDDVVLLRMNDDAVEALAYRKEISIPVDIVSQLLNPQIRIFTDSLFHQLPLDTKLTIEGERIFPGSFQEWCRPKVLIFLEPEHPEQSTIRAISAHEAMIKALCQSMVFMTGREVAAHYMVVLGKLVTTGARYLAKVGSDLLHSQSVADFFKALRTS